MKVNEESEKGGLKHNIQKTKIMTSGPITLWQIDGETIETVRGFILGALKSLQMVTSVMSDSATRGTVFHQAPLSMTSWNQDCRKKYQ